MILTEPEITRLERYSVKDGIADGMIVVKFKNIRESQIYGFLQSVSDSLEDIRLNLEKKAKEHARKLSKKTPASPAGAIASVGGTTGADIASITGTPGTQTVQNYNTVVSAPGYPSPRPAKTPKRIEKKHHESSPRLMGYHYNFIKYASSVQDLIKTFREKYPDYGHIPDKDLEYHWRKVHPDTKEPEEKKDEKEPMTRKELHKFQVNDRVVQVSGSSPGVGTGTVQSIRGDGVVTVKFISGTKCLHENCFKIAAVDKMTGGEEQK